MPPAYYVPGSRARWAADGFCRNVDQQGRAGRYHTDGLHDVGSDTVLYVVGHGAMAGVTILGLSPRQLFDRLKAEKLPRTHKRFKLFSCMSGVVLPGEPKCYAELFAHEIRDYYKSASVTGYTGIVKFDEAGQKQVETVYAEMAGVEVEGEAGQRAHRARDRRVQFAVKRAWVGTNAVAADPGNAKAFATVSKTVGVESLYGESVDVDRLKVVIYPP
jgi:hypothetical protein